MKFNINNYKGKYVMHCKTEEEAKDFCKFLESIGLEWRSGRSYLEHTDWKHYMENICYDFNRRQRSSLEYYKENNYTILEWSDFMNREFTKSDLKNGDVVLRRNGDVEIVCLETDTFICQDVGWNDLLDINEDLTYKLCCNHLVSEYDIMAVRRPREPGDCQFSAFDKELGELIYERKEVEEMTLEEVCKLLGKEIKIVKSK